MRPSIIIIYNKPDVGMCASPGEEKAITGVLNTVRAVYRALLELGYPVSRLSLSPPLESARKILSKLTGHTIFNLFEGFTDDSESEAHIAALLEELGLSYTGCNSQSLALALNKFNSKGLLRSVGIYTPGYQLLSPETLSEFNLHYPCIIKPFAEDASLGITADSVVNDDAALKRQVTKICSFYRGKALVEEYIEGREFNITVFGNDKPEVLPVSEIVFSLPPGMPNVLTYEAKWIEGSTYFKGTKVVCPAQIDNEIKEYIRDVAIKAFRILNCKGYARLDLRMKTNEYPCVIEVNPNPDISPGTGAARQAKVAGMKYSQFIEKIMSFALEGIAV